jgi:peptide/nickel transport system permease protein
LTLRAFTLMVGRHVLGAAAVVVLVTALAWILLHSLRPDLFGPDADLFGYLGRVFLHFDFGTSEGLGRPDVAEVLRERVPADAALFLGGLAVGMLGGIAGGAYAATRGRSASAWLMQAAAMLAMCTPVYVVGMSFLLLFGQDIAIVDLGVGIPVKYVEFDDSPVRWLGALVVPWIVLGLPLAGLLLRSMYGATREALAEEPVRTARAKGLSERLVLRRHAVPLGVGPALSLAGAAANVMLTNMVLLERVFNVPGVFQRLPQSVGQADVAMLLALTLVGAVFVSLTSMISDVLLAWVDPRVRR